VYYRSGFTHLPKGKALPITVTRRSLAPAGSDEIGIYTGLPGGWPEHLPLSLPAVRQNLLTINILYLPRRATYQARSAIMRADVGEDDNNSKNKQRAQHRTLRPLFK